MSCRPGRYGKAHCENFYGIPYSISLYYSQKNLSSKAYNPFIKELDLFKNTRLEDYGEELHVYDQQLVVCSGKREYILYQYEDYYDRDSYVELDKMSIPGDEDYDYVDRIEKCRIWLNEVKNVVGELKSS